MWFNHITIINGVFTISKFYHKDLNYCWIHWDHFTITSSSCFLNWVILQLSVLKEIQLWQWPLRKRGPKTKDKELEGDKNQREWILVTEGSTVRSRGKRYTLVEIVGKNQWNMEMLAKYSKKKTCVILTLCSLVWWRIVGPVSKFLCYVDVWMCTISLSKKHFI